MAARLKSVVYCFPQAIADDVIRIHGRLREQDPGSSVGPRLFKRISLRRQFAVLMKFLDPVRRTFNHVEIDSCPSSGIRMLPPNSREGQ